MSQYLGSTCPLWPDNATQHPAFFVLCGGNGRGNSRGGGEGGGKGGGEGGGEGGGGEGGGLAVF